MENGGEGKKGTKGDNDSGQASQGKIFVGGLSWETTTEKLTKHFKKYGEIIDSVVMRDRSTGHPRGFGFVTYSDLSVIDKVIKDSHLIDGRTVEIKRSVPRENMVKGPKTKKVFVGGLPLTISEGELKNYFTQFGNVVEHQIMHDHGSGRSRGFGFITFDSEQIVDDLLSQNKVLELGGKEIEVKKAEPKKPAQEEPAYDPPPRRGAYGYGGAGGYGGYDEGSGRYGSSLYGRSEGYGDGMYGSSLYGRSEGYGDGMYGSGYGGGGYGGYGGSSMGGIYGGYGSSTSQYGEADLYTGRGYGGYSGGYSSSGYGSMSGYGSTRSNSGGRYHPYGRN